MQLETALKELGSLKKGNHKSPDDGACVMEAASYIAGEPWSDHPKCVSPVLGAFLRNWNDSLETDADRDRLLKPLLPKIINTAGPANFEEQRSYMALDWMIRTFLPAWLRLAKLNDEAAKIEGLSPIIDMAAALAAGAVVREAQQSASKAKAAAWAAARDAAGAAAGAAAWDAARDAAWDAARDAAGAAAGAAARDAAGAAAWDAARDAAKAAAWAAAGAAAGAAARDAAWDAAWDAARDALKETKLSLQTSAARLVERMADVYRTEVG